LRNSFFTIFFFSLLFFSFSGYSQRILQVIDGNTGEALPGATLTLDQQILVADSTGRIKITEDARGLGEVRFIGYVPQQVAVSTAGIIRLFPNYEVLETVTVFAYQRQRPLAEVAGSYASIEASAIEGMGASGTVSAVNALPGIRMEKRSPGSYRMNIRGSTLRSPFGVRNVKVYYNQIPVTEPTGNTPLNLLDLEHLNGISFIRAPASSLYGAGIGGVMFLDGQVGGQEGMSGSVDSEIGSFGYYTFHTGLEKRDGENYFQVHVSATGTDGYRDHTEMDRKNVSLTGRTVLSENQYLSYTLLYNDLFYELPGGLTAEQRDAEPTQARQIAIDQNSSFDQQYLIAGIEHGIEWAENSGNQTSFFFTTSDKENPFITNYEFEDLTGGGLRSRFYHTITKDDFLISFSAGGEWQWGRFKANNFGNSGGFPDTLRYVDDTRMFTGFEFVQAEIDSDKWHITIGASLNHLKYDFNRKKDVALDSSYRLVRRFDNQFSPRIGVVRELGRASVFINASYGFSTPTQDEVRTSDGSINTQLESEIAWSLEAGVRADLVGKKLYGDLTLFHILQENTIVSRVDEFGNSLFLNSGETIHQGVEMLLGYRMISKETGWIRNLHLQGSLAWHDLYFRKYIREQFGDNVDFSGNDLTGGVPLTYHLQFNLQMSGRTEFMVSHLFTDEIALNDANTVFSRSYHLLRARIQKSFGWGTGKLISVHVGADNILNKSYSLGNDLNAFGSRYFNPSPTRNYFGGIGITFL
jgi:iron complex outermembrane recepter protein